MGVGFLITMITIWLVGATQAALGWRSVFMMLAVGPAIGIIAKIALRQRLRDCCHSDPIFRRQGRLTKALEGFLQRLNSERHAESSKF